MINILSKTEQICEILNILFSIYNICYLSDSVKKLKINDIIKHKYNNFIFIYE